MRGEDLLDEPIVEGKQTTFKLSTLFYWGIPLGIGFLLRLLHWPLGGVFIVSSSAGITAYLFHGILRDKVKHPVNTVMAILAVMWGLIFIWGAFFNGGYPYNKKGLTVYGVVLVIFFGLYSLIHIYRKIKNR